MILWALVGIGGVVGVLLLQSGEAPAGLPECAMSAAFHLSCATCGFSRAAMRLAHGDVVGSWLLHPFAAIAAAEAVVGWTAWGAGHWRGRSLISARSWVRVLVVTAVGAVGYWLVRLSSGMIPN